MTVVRGRRQGGVHLERPYIPDGAGGIQGIVWQHMQVPVRIRGGHDQRPRAPDRLREVPDIRGRVVPDIPVVGRGIEPGSEGHCGGGDPGASRMIRRHLIGAYGRDHDGRVRAGGSDIPGEVGGEEPDLVGGPARGNPAAGQDVEGRPQVKDGGKRLRRRGAVAPGHGRDCQRRQLKDVAVPGAAALAGIEFPVVNGEGAYVFLGPVEDLGPGAAIQDIHIRVTGAAALAGIEAAIKNHKRIQVLLDPVEAEGPGTAVKHVNVAVPRATALPCVQLAVVYRERIDVFL